MSTTLKKTIGSPVTAIAGSTLNALASASYGLGSALNWTQGNSGDGYPNARLQLTFKFQAGPATNTGFSIWALKSPDGGTTYEDSSAAPPRPPDATFLAHAFGGTGDTNAHVVSVDIDMPVGYVKFLLLNNATGQALTANNTDNVLTVTPISYQQV